MPDDADFAPPDVAHAGVEPEARIPFASFVASLKGTPDELYVKILKANHNYRAHTLSEWRAHIAAHAQTPAPPVAVRVMSKR